LFSKIVLIYFYSLLLVSKYLKGVIGVHIVLAEFAKSTSFQKYEKNAERNID